MGMVRLTLSVVVTLLMWVPVHAQQPSIKVRVSQSSIEIGSSGRIIVSVIGGKPELAIPREISAEGLSITLVDQSFVEPEYFYYYRVASNKPGKYKIPSIQTILQGRTVASEPIAIEVVPRSKAIASGSPRFGLIEVPKSKLYVNQMFPLEATLYVKGQNAFVGDGSFFAELDHESFVIQRFDQFDKSRETVEGTFYSTAKMSTTLFGLKSGVHKVGPVVFDVRIYVENGRIYGPSATRVTVDSETTDLKIHPLPSDSPSSFTGGVGDFEMESKASPLNLRVGDPIAVDFTINGVGNFETMTTPVIVGLNSSEWKQYTPKKKIEVSSNGILPGRATFSQVLVPLRSTSLLPEFEFTYFSPENETYVTLKTPARRLNILEEVASSESEAEMASVKLSTDVINKRNEVLFIGESDFELEFKERKRGSKLFLLAMNVVLGAAFIVSLLGCLMRNRKRNQGSLLVKKQLSFKEASRLVKAGLSRNDFFHKALAAFKIWEGEHDDAPDKVRDLVREMRRKCEDALYSETGDHSEASISTAEADQYIKVLRTIPVKKL